MTTNEIGRRETVITYDPDVRDLRDLVGLPYTFVTWEGNTIEGVTEVKQERLAHVPVPVDRLIVRFADGGWAYALISDNA